MNRWGYDRIQGALANLGFHISDPTVGNILKAHGIEPAPERESRTAWRTFLAAHWDSIAAADFTTVERKVKIFSRPTSLYCATSCNRHGKQKSALVEPQCFPPLRLST